MKAEINGLNLKAIDKETNKEVDIFNVIFIRGYAFGVCDIDSNERKLLELRVTQNEETQKAIEEANLILKKHKGANK